MRLEQDSNIMNSDETTSNENGTDIHSAQTSSHSSGKQTGGQVGEGLGPETNFDSETNFGSQANSEANSAPESSTESSDDDRLNPRKTAKQKRSKETVDYIIQATRRILKTGENLTTNRIAKVAGISIGSLYQYFPNRESILRYYAQAEIQKNLAEYLDTFKELEQSQLSLEQKIDKMIDFFVSSFSKTRPIFSFFFERAFGLGIVPMVLEVEEKKISKVREILKRHSHEIKVDDIDLAAYVVTQTSLGVMRSRWIRKEGPVDTDLAEELKVLLKAYLLK